MSKQTVLKCRLFFLVLKITFLSVGLVKSFLFFSFIFNFFKDRV